jgi:hypothetical protein
MGRVVAGGSCLGVVGLASDDAAGDSAHTRVLGAGSGDHAAERNGRGLGRRFRRGRQPDGVWSARRDDVSFASYHVVRDCLYDDLADAFREARSYGDQHGVDSRADAAYTISADEKECDAAAGQGACAARACTGSEPAAACAQVAAFSEFSCGPPSREWRNWQTYQLAEFVEVRLICIRLPQTNADVLRRTPTIRLVFLVIYSDSKALARPPVFAPHVPLIGVAAQAKVYRPTKGWPTLGRYNWHVPYLLPAR